MARRGECGRQVVVSVVGVSGGEREKGVTGVGKSCLCNRFIRPQADNYHVDHISVLSQTDFSGRVVNNDHFLYWGETTRVSEDAIDYNFQVIEQTEFIDDASFMPFKAGKMDPYIKRCGQTKITSAEKLMYICKNQLGIEKEYEQKVLPDGKLNVDGFLCIFDVSQVPNRSLERMVELTASILNTCVKTKRPVVLVTTKNDEANEIYVKEAEKLASRKEFKGNIPLVETSSHEIVNVDTAFLTVAQLVERNRGRIRILPFYEAARHRKEMLDVATDAYLRLVRSSIVDYRALWSSSSKRLANSPDFVHYVDLLGLDSAAKLFRRHTRKLKDEFLQRKVESYMDLLPSILREFFPNLRSLQDGDWLTIQQRISEHPDFERYFLRCHEDLPWSENLDLLDSADSRIPFDVLDSNEAETVFKNHVNALQAELEMREMRDRFKQLLAETGYVTAGKRLDEVRVLFMGRESFDSLTEHDRQIIYDQHQKEITEKARANYMELLLEHAELFNHVKSVAPNGSITQEDVRDITQALNTDSRHKALDRLDGERTLLLLQHLGFVHCPKPEHCPAHPNCTDTLVNKLLAGKHASRPSSWSGKSVGSGCSPLDRHINLVLLGGDGLAHTLHAAIRTEFPGDEVEVEGEVYCLDYRTIDGDVSQPQYAFRTPDFSPHGVVCAYSTSAGLEYLRASLEHQLLSQLEREEAAPATAILYTPDPSLDKRDQQALHQDGTSLAQSLQCSFVDAGPSCDSSSGEGVGEGGEGGEGGKGEGGGEELDRGIVSRTIRKLVTSLHHRTTSLSLFQSATLQPDACPDIRVIMCVLCGDPYSLEAVLSPLLSSPWCVPAGDRTLQIHTFLDESKRVVEVSVSSYHGANAFREDLVHGFILVYSAKRKASLAALKAFSSNIPNLPIQVLAVTESSSASAFFGSELTQQLMTEGNAVADRLQAHYTTTTATPHQKSTTFTPFFKEVWDKKPEIEQAFNMEDPSGLDDSGEGTLERPPEAVRALGRGGSAFTPVHRSRGALPPRSHSAEGSEIYESVPPGCDAFGGSLGDDLDEPLSPSLGGVYGGDELYPPRHPAHYPQPHYGGGQYRGGGPPSGGVGGSLGSSTQQLTPSDDSDIYSHIDNDDDEQQLVKPSQIKKQRRFQQESDRRSFPSTESLPTSMSARSHLPCTPSSEQPYQNSASVRAVAAAAAAPPKAKRSNSTSSSPPSHAAAHSASSLYKKVSPGATSSPPLHKAASQQIAREHSFDGSLYGRHGASFRRRGSTGVNGGSATAGLRGNRSGGSMSGLLMGGLDLIPADNPPPVPPPLNLSQNPPLPKSLPPPLPSVVAPSQRTQPQQDYQDTEKPQPAPRKQFLKSESVETGIGSGSGSGSSNNSSRCNTSNKDEAGTLGSSKSCNDEPCAPNGENGASTTGGGGGSSGGSSVGGGLQVYPPPTTPPEPAPPDRESVEGRGAGGPQQQSAGRRLVKATTLPAPTFHAAASRTSLEDLTSDLSGSRDSLTTPRDSGTTPDHMPRWADDSGLCGPRRSTDDYWVGASSGVGERPGLAGGVYPPHSSTTGRRGRLPPPPTRAKPKASHTLKTFQSLSDAVSQVTNKQPGKLNLKAYSNVTDALSKIAVVGSEAPRHLTKPADHQDPDDTNAPLATPECVEDLGTDSAAVKDAVPGLYPEVGGGAGEFAYSRVPELSQAASAKARQRQRREKHAAGQPQAASASAYSDSDSDWSSLERRRNADSSRKSVPKRVKKKRIPIPVATPRVPAPPRVPPLPAPFYVAEPGSLTAQHALDDNKPLLLEQADKGSRSGDSSGEESDADHCQLPSQPLLPPPNKAGLQKKGFQFKSKSGREGVAVRPPVVPFPPSVPSSSPSPLNSSSLLGRGLTISSPRPPYQLTPDSDVTSPLCKAEDGAAGGGYFPEDSSLEMPSPRDLQSPNPSGGPPTPAGTTPATVLQDKNARKKQEKLKSKEEARQREDEKKRVKEEEKQKKKERENKKKSGKSGGKGAVQKAVINWEQFVQGPDHPVPLFVEKCVKFIELEGLDSEGIYRVPGNKVHVEHLTIKFKEDNGVDFVSLDVPVNAAATALKDYLKQLPPLLPQSNMEQLTAIAGQSDRSCRLLRLKELLTGLPTLNFLIIKFIFQHFVRVAEHCKLNSMDSKNLAICWWPTLFHTLQFSDIVEFESLRPHIEDVVQTMIDQFPFLFQGKEDYVMV